MQLTKQTDFAFRTLLYLAELPAGKLANIKEICDFYGISKNHIAKVVMKLTKLGMVRAVRGNGGGIALAVPAETISLAYVVENFETTLQPVNCTVPRCKILSSCQLKGVLFDASRAFMDTLKGKTLADVCTAGNKTLDGESAAQVLEIKS
ncbi:Rrf2 family transcriptional regulator [Spongiibacter sp. KMU-158]|uniref:Rrf2 family transcriptional regulator n=1 Tax=Spongiibacter pelagi TaxID=2760804 RepID=A0A927C0S5_9GAMM|nr:Rrf2 family transcriptional regulator [Spongiibacter pelagi]MBD2857455.1 Rrf2 family transcriptional regulator [Spongiibacter pelagi]